MSKTQKVVFILVVFIIAGAAGFLFSRPQTLPDSIVSKWPEGVIQYRHNLPPAEQAIQAAIYEASQEIERCHQIELRRQNSKYPENDFMLEMELNVTAEGEFENIGFTFRDKTKEVEGLKNCLRGILTPLRIPAVPMGLPKYDVIRLYFRRK